MVNFQAAYTRFPLLLCVLLSFGFIDSTEAESEAEPNPVALDSQNNGGGIERLLEAAGKSRVVLLGEASHGTHEFYAWRARLSQALIEAGEVAFIALEGDTATLGPLDRYVRHSPGSPRSARAALEGITHWPSWVWANAELADFAEWLHEFNGRRPHEERVAIHGLDLYAISAALDKVERFYRRHASEYVAFVSQLQSLFAPFRETPGIYADAVQATHRSLRPYAQAIVHDLDTRYRRSSPRIRESIFLALQNARAAAAGLGYLEALPGPPLLSANLRSRHFGLTLKRLLVHSGPDSRGIVWAHNTHVGDSRATTGRFVGEFSLGRLARQSLGAKAVFIVGFGTGAGDVLASKYWGGPCEILSTPVPRPDSLEAKLSAAGENDRLWLFSSGQPVPEMLTRWIPHRAVGSTFDPAREAHENYVATKPAARYDAFIFVSHTHHLRALDWPSGLARCSRRDAD